MRTCAVRAAKIRAQLDDVGYVHVREAVTLGAFERLAAALGRIVRREEIALYRSTRGAHRPGPLGLHTDPAHVATIAWWCKQPAAEGGATQLLDLAAVFSDMPRADQALLRHVRLRSPDPDGGPPRIVPFVSWMGADPRLFYADWQVLPISDRPTNAAWKRLRAHIEAAANTHAFGIRLEPGQVLVIDNRRFVHGRGRLPPDSPRCLLRLWIAHDDAPRR